jgi:hypothetical protein
VTEGGNLTLAVILGLPLPSQGASPIPGTNGCSHLEDNLAAATMTLMADEIRALNNVTGMQGVAGKRPSTLIAALHRGPFRIQSPVSLCRSLS